VHGRGGKKGCGEGECRGEIIVNNQSRLHREVRKRRVAQRKKEIKPEHLGGNVPDGKEAKKLLRTTRGKVHPLRRQGGQRKHFVAGGFTRDVDGERGGGRVLASRGKKPEREPGPTEPS